MKKKKYTILLACLAALFIINQAFTQEKIPALVTDRPDQTESSVTVPLKSWQIEMGGLMEKDKGAEWNNSTMEYPGVLVRYGILKNFELRFGASFGEHLSTSRTNEADKLTRGLNPLSAGFKVFISEEKGILPELSFIGNLVIPRTGHPDFELNRLIPAFLFAASHTLSDYLSLGWNIGAEWQSFNPKANGIYSIVAGLSASDRLGFFIESYGRIAIDEDADHRMDAGFTYLVMPNFQVDASAGMGITEAAPDYFIGIGASLRILQNN